MCAWRDISSFQVNAHSDLRQLHSLRPPLPDVPAVYFVSPTLANIRRIAEDLQKPLYESFHLNFVEPLPRALLEELAASVARDGTGELVEQVRVYGISQLSMTSITFLLDIGLGPISVIHCPVAFTLLSVSAHAAAAAHALTCNPTTHNGHSTFNLHHPQLAYLH